MLFHDLQIFYNEHIQFSSSGKMSCKNLILFNYLLYISREARNQSSSCRRTFVPSLLSPEHPKPSLIPLLTFQKGAAFWDVHSWFQLLSWSQTFLQECRRALFPWVRFSSSPIWSINSFVNSAVIEHLICARQYQDAQNTKSSRT